MTLKIISAQDTVYDGQVSSVTLPGTLGEFTVLNNHASLLSTLTPGKVKYKDTQSGETVTLSVQGGIVDIDNNIVSVCVF